MAAVALVAGCGNDDGATPGELDGRTLALDSGCAGCHGTDFSGSIGPTWRGLYGSEVTLDDGTTVTADRDYLAEAIRDPSAKRVEGYTVVMPHNRLTDDEIDAIVDYIETLAETPP